ncbi:sporulation protein [Geobacillus subterraneus]|uniref:Sporulation protein n=2 Tax=Geobacillus TaxID=129337 RepID=A0ABN4NI91_9BACL|nr:MULTISPECIES: putative sporulation protein YtxC [Geobacillus]AMX82655.1 sporulation protein [Geobacillus subterraneus]KZS26263.1 sporulation protein [Geobacillus subterraneus]OXB90746.1 sporulation protein [Geobacillus uzenensis]QIZ68622.1 putative sporulation protein YtxC [Geobacillus subterraneus]WPZ17646.1 putative sporulation protein YtxC [Geobacillus subterraneus]
MIEIHFDEASEAEKLFWLLNERKRDACPLFHAAYDGNNTVAVYIHGEEKHVLERHIIPAMTAFVQEMVEDRLLLSIISDVFYFRDVEEQQQILALAHSFLDGERRDYRKGAAFAASRAALVRGAFASFLRDGLSFSFSSFVTFRLKPYMERLQHYVELAIDEYKLEQEYQTFVQMLRDCLASRTPKWTRLYLVHDPPRFLFYDSDRRELSTAEVKQMIDRHLVFSQPMYIDSSVLAPLVSLAPAEIELYTDHPDDGMVQTMQNVFQERLRLRRRADFLRPSPASAGKREES